MRPVAVFLLLLGAMRHMVWPMFPPDQQAQIWNLAGAVSISCLLVLVWHHNRGMLAGSAVLWFLYEEFLVGTCSVWSLIEPYTVPIGEGQCIAKTGTSVISISLVALGVLIQRVSHER